MTLSTNSNKHAPTIICDKIRIEYELSTSGRSTLKEYLLEVLKGQKHSKTFTALKEISLTIKNGECLAFLGHNGSGKSTLLKVIAGILAPQSGSLKVEGTVAPLIELGAGFDPELTGRENTYLSCGLLGLSRHQVDTIVEDIKKFAELGDFFESPVKTYSSGMYMRLGFSCCMAVNADILLIDEILAVGDENFQKKCTEKLNSVRQSGATILLVSHSLDAVKRMADRVVVLDHGEIKFDGQPLPAIEYYLKIMEEARLRLIPAQIVNEETRKKNLSENFKDFVTNSSKKVQINKAEFLQNNLVVLDLEPRKPWQLKIHLTINENQSTPICVGFAIHNQQNQRVMGGNNKNFSQALNLSQILPLQAKGDYIVVYSFHDAPLATGDYKLITAIHDWSLENTLDLNMETLLFRAVAHKDLNNFDRDFIPCAEYICDLQHLTGKH